MASRMRTSIMASTLFGRSEAFFEQDGSSAIGSDDEALNESHEGNHAHEALRQEREIVEKMVLEETHNVRLWRRNVVLVMVLTGALVSAMTYSFLKGIDTEDYEVSAST